jgi:hypothetical protein
MEKFYKTLDEWLWQSKKTFNPFTRFLSKLSEDNPDVPEPEVSEERRYEEHQRENVNPS